MNCCSPSNPNGNKKWYLSKTVWVNVAFIAALIAQKQFGFVAGPEEQAAVIVFLNLILRAITKRGLEA